jgi:hypothetical protein
MGAAVAIVCSGAPIVEAFVDAGARGTARRSASCPGPDGGDARLRGTRVVREGAGGSPAWRWRACAHAAETLLVAPPPRSRPARDLVAR